MDARRQLLPCTPVLFACACPLPVVMGECGHAHCAVFTCCPRCCSLCHASNDDSVCSATNTLAQALIGRGHAEPWAYAEYGWLLFEEGHPDTARMHLETALEALQRQGLVGQEAEAAEYHYKLGR